MKDSMKRSVVKTIFFKIVTTSVTACITGIGNAILIHLLMTIIYIVYERVWNKISWGKVKEEKPIQDLVVG